MTVDWGDIGGTLSNQTDLQAALDDKLEFSGGTANDVLTWDGTEIVGSSQRNPSTTNLQIFKNHTGIVRGSRLVWSDNQTAPYIFDFNENYLIQGTLDAGATSTPARVI